MLSMASDIRLALDPALIGSRVGLVLDPWQRELLTEQPKRALLCCARQSGKSTVTALLALHDAIYEAPALILLLSPSQRQSAELFRVLMGFHAKLEGAPALTAESLLRAELSNGSRIIALPGGSEGKTVRGYSRAALVVLDEAARIDDSLLAVVRPMLAVSDGSLIALSTPHGKRGWFFEAWFGDESWHRVRVPADQCPRLSKAFLDEELKALGRLAFSEEYNLEFCDSSESVFASQLVDRAFCAELQPLW
jgi:hypothetical protein